MKKITVYLSCLVIISLLCPDIISAQDVELKRTVKEALLVDTAEFHTEGEEVAPGLIIYPSNSSGKVRRISKMLVSPDLRHVALMIEEEGKWFVVYDSKIHEKYDNLLKQWQFSPDGKRLTYTGMIENEDSDTEWYRIIDGGKYGPYKKISQSYFSPDSEHLAYVACVDKSCFLVRDMVEEKSKLYDLGGPAIYSPNGERIALHVLKDEKSYMVIDGIMGPPFERSGFVSFSPDSNRIAYAGLKQEKTYLMVDGDKSKPYDTFNGFVFSPDSRHVSYGMKRGGKWRVVVDGKEGKPYDDLSQDIWYSPDSSRMVYWAREGKEQLIVIDGHEIPVPGVLGSAVFSADSKHVGYLIGDKKKKKSSVFIDDTVYEPYRGAGEVVFSPDSNKFAFPVAIKKKKMHIVLDGAEGKTYRWVGDIVFSPDSKHLAYGARDKKNWYVVLDGEEVGSYKEVGSIMFSPEGKYLIYGVTDKSGKMMIVVDGVEGKKYDGILRPPTPEGKMSRNVIFDSPNSFHYLAMKGTGIYLVEETLE